MVKKEFITISFSACIKLKLFIEYFISFNMAAPIYFDSDLYLVKANIIIVGRYKEIDNIENISIGKLFFRTKNINGYEGKKKIGHILFNCLSFKSFSFFIISPYIKLEGKPLRKEIIINEISLELTLNIGYTKNSIIEDNKYMILVFINNWFIIRKVNK